MSKKPLFVAYFYFQGFSLINLGVSLDLSGPNVELHIPFGFFRLGWRRDVWGNDTAWKFDTFVCRNTDPANPSKSFHFSMGLQEIFRHTPQ